MNTTMIERLAANSAPMRLPVEGDQSREQRNWIVRLATDVDEQDDAGVLAGKLSSAAQGAIRQARIERQLAAEVDQPGVSVRVDRIDPRHLVVSIATAPLEKDDAHEWLVAASAALRRLHQSAPVEDIQGIPVRFWKLVVGP